MYIWVSFDLGIASAFPHGCFFLFFSPSYSKHCHPCFCQTNRYQLPSMGRSSQTFTWCDFYGTCSLSDCWSATSQAIWECLEQNFSPDNVDAIPISLTFRLTRCARNNFFLANWAKTPALQKKFFKYWFQAIQ